MLDLHERGKALVEVGEVLEQYEEWYEEENGSFVDIEFESNYEGWNEAFALIYIYIFFFNFRFGLVGHFNEDLLWVEQHSLFLIRGEKKANSKEPT